MHRLFLIIVACLQIHCGNSVRPPVSSDAQWKLFWSDEFDYIGLPDSTKWDYETGGSGWGNNEWQYYTHANKDNAEVSNGLLHLRALKTDYDNKHYTSARLITRGKQEFHYGKIEIRAKLPAGRGLWPAFWMLGSNIDQAGWPDCGEVDIMEHVGFQPDSVFGTVHTAAYNHMIGTQKGKKIYIKDPYTNFHVYAVEWSPEKMDFYLDGQQYYSVANEHKTSAEWPFDKPFYLLLNIAVGGNLGGKQGVDDAVFPATMEVDYIRVYKKTNG